MPKTHSRERPAKLTLRLFFNSSTCTFRAMRAFSAASCCFLFFSAAIKFSAFLTVSFTSSWWRNDYTVAALLATILSFFSWHLALLIGPAALCETNACK